jgi:hypothetical protein
MLTENGGNINLEPDLLGVSGHPLFGLAPRLIPVFEKAVKMVQYLRSEVSEGNSPKSTSAAT